MDTQEFLQKWFGLKGELWKPTPNHDCSLGLTDEADEAWSKAQELLADLCTMGAFGTGQLIDIYHTLCENS